MKSQPMTPDTITLADVRVLWDKAEAAVSAIEGIYRGCEDGDISPAEAHAKLTEILAPLQMAKPEPKWRYFGTPSCYWKMPITGNGFVRGKNEPWEDSICDLSDFKNDKSEPEVTAQEAEP